MAPLLSVSSELNQVGPGEPAYTVGATSKDEMNVTAATNDFEFQDINFLLPNHSIFERISVIGERNPKK